MAELSSLKEILTEYTKKVIKPTTQALQHDKAEQRIISIGDNGLTQPDVNDILSYANDYEGALLQFYSNGSSPSHLISYGFVMKDLTTEHNPVLIEIDRDGVVTKWTQQTNYRVGGEQERGLNYSYVDNHTVNLLPAQVNLAKGIRVWTQIAHKGNVINQYVEMRFSDKATSPLYLGIPLPEPNAFSTQIAVQFFKNDMVVKTSSGDITKKAGLLEVVPADGKTLISDDTKIFDVRGIF